MRATQALNFTTAQSCAYAGQHHQLHDADLELVHVAKGIGRGMHAKLEVVVAVSSQVARQLAAPQPRDVSVTRQLRTYKGIQPPWDSWANVRESLADLAAAMVGGD